MIQIGPHIPIGQNRQRAICTSFIAHGELELIELFEVHSFEAIAAYAHCTYMSGCELGLSLLINMWEHCGRHLQKQRLAWREFADAFIAAGWYFAERCLALPKVQCHNHPHFVFKEQKKQ